MRGTAVLPNRDTSLFAGVRWERVTLPPTREPVIDRMEADATPSARHAEMVQAYYAPAVVAPDGRGNPGRELRVAARQVVAVAEDGTVLATWKDRADEHGSAVFVPRPRTGSAHRAPAVATYADLLALLADLAVPVSRHCWGDHHRVHTPDGRPDLFLPVDPVPGDDVAADADLLARLGVFACPSTSVAVG